MKQIVTHISCKSQFFCVVALLRMRAGPNCRVLFGRAGDQPPPLGGQQLRGLCGRDPRVLWKALRGEGSVILHPSLRSRAPPPLGASPSPMAPGLLEPSGIEPTCNEWAGQLHPFFPQPHPWSY